MTIVELLCTAEKWTQHASARTWDEHAVGCLSPDAVKFCVVGALHRCYGPSQWAVMHKRIERCLWRRGIESEIVVWQNKPERTFKEVMSVLKEANV